MAGGDVTEAAVRLKLGELVIMPTETVYGLAADATDPIAVARLYEAKGRPRFNPLIAHVASLDEACRLGDFDPRALALAAAFWPGPLTLVVPAVEGPLGVCSLARAGLQTVALRVPRHPVALSLLEKVGGPLVAPSANRSGRPSPTNLADAMEETGPFAALGLDGGACAIGLESTVVACLDGPPRLLRPGGLERSRIEAVVGPLLEADDDARRSPGRLALHYAPQAPVRINAAGPEAGEAYLAFGSAPEGALSFNLSPGRDLREAAANLFTLLRSADRTHPRAIAVAPIPSEGLGEAINDRLKRAAGFVG